MNIIGNLQFNQVRQNNEQINDLIEQILKIRREYRIPIEENGIIDSKVEQLLLYEVKKCLDIYKLEFPNYECQGKDTVSFREQRTTADCYGGISGLEITYGMQEFVDDIILPTMKKIGYRIDENGEPSFDDTFNGNTEHSSNSNINSFKKYVGSTKDQMDYFTLLLAKNGVDLDFVWDALAHEEMHTFGVNNGNNFLKEGTTEELTREICEKYNIHMSPHAHTQEADFVRKLEMLVGRDLVIDAGMWTGKFKALEFASILEENPKLEFSELSEMFELLKSDPKKLEETEKKNLEQFCEKNPRVAVELKEIGTKYRKAESKNERYAEVAKKFDNELEMKEGSFYKYAEILDSMYALSQNYKQDFKIYRDIYTLPLEELEKNIKDGVYNEPKAPEKRQKFRNEQVETLTNIRAMFKDLSEMNPQIQINSFSELIAPINEKIIDRNFTTNDKIEDYSEVLSTQEKELSCLKLICKEYGIPIDDEKNTKRKNNNEIVDSTINHEKTAYFHDQKSELYYTEQKIGKTTINTSVHNKDMAYQKVVNKIHERNNPEQEHGKNRR